MKGSSSGLNKNIAHLHGSSRNRRFIPALHPGYFKIDERTLADLLIFAEQYAGYVHADGYEDGPETAMPETWKAFLAQDISILLAKIYGGKPRAATPWSVRGDRLKPLARMGQKLTGALAFMALLQDTLPYTHHAKRDNDNPRITYFFEQLEAVQHAAADVLIGCERAGIVIDDERLLTWIQLRNAYPYEFLTEQERMTVLDAALDNFLAFAASIKHTAKTLFEESLQHNDHHNPAVAMLISFLKLYEHAQADLNRITEKHLDYFFKTVLQQQPRPPAPDQVHVCFKLSDHVDSCLIKKGTLFKAGLDEDGLDYLYEAEDYVKLNKTQVTALASCFVSRKEEIGVEPHYEFISALYKSAMLFSEAGGFDFSASTHPFPAFGEEQYDIRQKTMERSEIGFAISSPVLLLREGTRTVDLTLQFNLKSMTSLVAFFERYAEDENLSADGVFHRVFAGAFAIELTTAVGWYRMADYKVLPPQWGSGKVMLSFTLPMGGPAIIPAEGEAWPPEELARYDTPWPVMKISLVDDRSMYAYSYLKHLILQEVDIQVDVKGVKNLEVYNDLGKLETSTPFFPFGPIPVPGSSFVVGYDELYKKNIRDVSLEITWHNLPTHAGGLKAYYSDYDTEIDNDSFVVGITGLSDFEFYPKRADQVQTFPLYTTAAVNRDQSTARPVALHTVIDGIDVNALRMNAQLDREPLQPFDNTTKSGYLKVELLAPAIGFGHQEYATIMPVRMMKQAKTGDVRLPNPPFAPQMKSLSLHYTGATKISFHKLATTKADPRAQEKIYQLQPFGIRTIFKDRAPIVDGLLPQYGHNGYFFIGLDHVVPGEAVTFYFALDKSVVVDHETIKPQLSWFFVSNDTWIPFDPRAIIYDTTKNFVTSGIVMLTMPASMTNNNTILPADHYWIIVGLKGDTRLTGMVKGVYTQALQLRWKPHTEGALWQDNIPADTIHEMALARSEIAAVFQPMPSFGGRPAEAVYDFYTRVSERLTHKNRGVTPWDIERLVLEKFPVVRQVKCVSPADQPDFVASGKIVLVVVPRLTGQGAFTLPRFSTDELENIQQYVQKQVSPFVQVSVMNPVYEEVKVTANIVLTEDTGHEGNEDNLHRDIRSFICPWHDQPHEDMVFGGWMNLDEFSDFLMSRPYVRSLSGVSIVIVHYHHKDYSLSDSVATTELDKTLYAGSPWSVLIPMRVHQLTVEETDRLLTPEKAAIENMRLGNEFVVGDATKKSTTDTHDADGPPLAGYVMFDIDL